MANEKKLLAFSKNLALGVGGAEKSIHAELKYRAEQGDAVTLSYCEKPSNYDSSRLAMDWGYPYEEKPIKGIKTFNRFFYLEYLFNRKKIAKHIREIENDFEELWAQNLWAPIAINNFKGKTYYFARDYTFLNQRPNFQVGPKRLLKHIYDLIDWFGFFVYRRDNLKAIKNASVLVANSKFMAKEIKILSGRNDIEVVLPKIEFGELKKEFAKRADEVTQKKGVVLIGESIIKGRALAEQLAETQLDTQFYIFGRDYETASTIGNVTYMPWSKSSVTPFLYAKAVIVPSVCPEAYGRVAAESLALGIPCLVRNIGGLPEAVNYDNALIADTDKEFANKLDSILKSLDSEQ